MMGLDRSYRVLPSTTDRPRVGSPDKKQRAPQRRCHPRDDQDADEAQPGDDAIDARSADPCEARCPDEDRHVDGASPRPQPHALSEAQRALVRDNLGLITVHIKRHVFNLSQPRRDREWEDLFQEGCLGLVQAAMRHQPERGIPFAAFALPRIHSAVSRALHTRFATVYFPPARSAENNRKARDDLSRACPPRPKVVGFTHDLEAQLVDGSKPPSAHGLSRSIGERLRDKYDLAVRGAAAQIMKRASTRGDRDKLVQLLIEERLLIPHAEARRALRQVARDTQSSYARVAQCEKLLIDCVRTTLSADPEFRELSSIAKRSPDGMFTEVDDGVENRLKIAVGQEFADRYRRGNDAYRAGMLHVVLQRSHCEIDDIIRSTVMRLPGAVRRQLLIDTGERSDRKGRSNDPVRKSYADPGIFERRRSA